MPLPGNPLKEINSYFIRGTYGDLLIDTGFRRSECMTALLGGLKDIGWKRERLDVLLTHIHSDHSGLSADIAGDDRKIYISKPDFDLEASVLNGQNRRLMHDRFVSEGFPDETVTHIQDNNPAAVYSLRDMDPRFTIISDGDEIHVGSRTLSTIIVPGHTPGNMMFWLEKEKIMFTGDNVLFDITPNITAFAGVDDALGNYLDSLGRVRDYPVELALPGHRKTGDYRERIDTLLWHHRIRIEEARSVIESFPGLTAYDITGHMTWKIRAKDWNSFPETQKWYAVGECLSHLDYLRKREIIRRELEAGTWRYYTV